MNEAQITQLLTALGVLGVGGLIGALRWSVGRITATIDSNTAAFVAAAAAGATQAESNRAVATTLLALTAKLDDLVGPAPRALVFPDTGPIARRGR